MYYETVIIIGSGTIACECSKILKKMNVKHLVMENNPTSMSMLAMQCKKNKIPLIERKNLSIEEDLINHSKGNVLIISANNEHIFKPNIFRENITIINFHYGLLPDYRGINIPTWVIYNKEKYTGATWHYIDEHIDNGDIICQSKFEIKEFDTAFEITKLAMHDGAILFENFVRAFLDEPIRGIRNDSYSCNHIYYRKDLPGDGFITEDMDSELLVRMLRAYDYGPVEYISRLKLKDGKTDRRILRYRIYKNNRLIIGNERWKSDVKIIKDDFNFELLFCN